ncbi:hypothetical protein [Allokutzneria albata]|nr:hypothetical protein [Allokutzneria albata]
MRKSVVSALAVVVMVGVAVPAQAAEPKVRLKCGKSGFTGWVEIYGRSGSDGFGGIAPLARITQVRYKIKKPADGRTERNDVTVDYVPAPDTRHLLARSGDAARADNSWHKLNPEFTMTKTRHPVFEVEFIFNTSGKDPRCRDSQRL